MNLLAVRKLLALGIHLPEVRVAFHKDENYAKLFADSRFRQAMSICVDREQVSGLLTEGFLEPGQCLLALGIHLPEVRVAFHNTQLCVLGVVAFFCGQHIGVQSGETILVYGLSTSERA